MYCTVELRTELEAGMARQRNEIAEYTSDGYVKQYVIASPSGAHPLPTRRAICQQKL